MKLAHRLPVLLTHGFFHLIGYDHEIDEDYQTMQEASKCTYWIGLIALI